ncbi:MAG: NADP-specific glutamate dehydrogenase [Flavobacteriales bacterium]
MSQDQATTRASDDRIEGFLRNMEERNPGQPEFLQAVREVVETVLPYMDQFPEYTEAKVLERLCEPERVILFKITWTDDQGKIQVNRGFRVQMNSAIGPYKGGLRFHPTVNISVLKFLAFEQIFKNSLTGLPLGAGKGGADFDPKGRTDGEIMRFCQSFMSELQRHIGAFTDIPAGDIGVGGQEIGYLFGQYKRLRNEFSGVLTGKGMPIGGSLIRPEATGYGCVYFTEEMMKTQGENLEGKEVVISGSGNVAQFACEKALDLGARVLTMSDSSGYIHDTQGIDREKLEFIKRLKNEERGRISKAAEEFGMNFHPELSPWRVPCQVALPCATENELGEEAARKLIENGVKAVAEGANMPCTIEAITTFAKNSVLFAPGKASNAGGVAVSGLEMSQNAMRYNWWKEEVDDKLREIMKNIHASCMEYGAGKYRTDYVKGANIAGFVKVANAMLAQGHV